MFVALLIFKHFQAKWANRCSFPSWFSTIGEQNETIHACFPLDFNHFQTRMSRSMLVAFLVFIDLYAKWADPCSFPSWFWAFPSEHEQIHCLAGGQEIGMGGLCTNPPAPRVYPTPAVTIESHVFSTYVYKIFKAVCALLCYPFQLVSIIIFWNRRIFHLADHHDSQNDEISLLVQKVKSSVLIFMQK